MIIYILYMCIHTVYIYTQMYVSLCIIQILQVYIYIDFKSFEYDQNRPNYILYIDIYTYLQILFESANQP